MKNKFSTKKIIIVAVSFLLLLVILKKVGVLGGNDKPFRQVVKYNPK